MIRPQSPCGGCKDRRLGCHSDCKIYADFKADAEAYNDLIREAADYGQVVTYSRTQLKRMGRIKS